MLLMRGRLVLRMRGRAWWHILLLLLRGWRCVRLVRRRRMRRRSRRWCIALLMVVWLLLLRWLVPIRILLWWRLPPTR